MLPKCASSPPGMKPKMLLLLTFDYALRAKRCKDAKAHTHKKDSFSSLSELFFMVDRVSLLIVELLNEIESHFGEEVR
jgi:hypothetical protein